MNEYKAQDNNKLAAGRGIAHAICCNELALHDHCLPDICEV